MADLKEKYADKKKKKKKKEMTESEKMPHGMSALESGSKQKISPQKQKKSPKKKVYKKILKLRRVKPELVKPKRVKKAPKIAKDKKSIKYRVDDPDYVRKEKSFYREERLRKIGAKVGLALAAAAVAAPKRKLEKRKVPDKKISAGKAAASKVGGAVSIAASLSAVAGEIAGGVETLSFKIKEKRRRRLLEKMKERDKKNLKKK
jgi:hypothetical protein